MIITLKIHRNDNGFYTPTGESITLQFSDFIPAREDYVHTEEGQVYRVIGRRWLPGGLLLDAVEIVEQERAA